MTGRIPVEGFTIDAEPSERGIYRLFTPAGVGYDSLTVEALVHLGIPVPPEHREGRLGLNEADTRDTASLFPVGPESRTDRKERVQNAAIEMCKQDVALWDEMDRQANRPLTPLGLSEQEVRAVSGEHNPAGGDNSGARYRGYQRLLDACNCWVAGVDGAS